MSNYIFIPDDNNMITLSGFRKGTIHYKINNYPYKTIFWSVKQTLLYKLSLKKLDLDMKALSSDEMFEYEKLFENFEITPNEKRIKECIIAFTDRKIIIGLKIIDKEIFLAFKSIRIKEIKEICKRNSVTISYDKHITHFLFSNEYLNEIPSYSILENIAAKFIYIKNKNKVFAKKLNSIFRL